MKVVHVITTIRKGGAENHLVSLVREQVKAGYEVVVCYLKKEPYWRNNLELLGVRVIDLEVSKLLSFFSFKLKDLIKKFRPDIVHAHLPPAELYVWLNIICLKDVKLIISKHNDKRFAPILLENFLMNLVAKRACKIIAISNAVKRYLVNRGIESSLINSIHYGISSNKFEDGDNSGTILREFGIGTKTLIFGTLSRLVRQKSLDTMIRGFAKFVENNKDIQCILFIVGREDSSKSSVLPELKKLVHNLKLSKLVIFTGFRDDALKILANFDIFLLTSVHEGLGLVLLEAMHLKKPIIATNVSAIPEIVGDAAILIPPKNAEYLERAMSRLVNYEERFNLAQRGYERVVNLFTIEKMFSETHKTYLEAIEV